MPEYRVDSSHELSLVNWITRLSIQCSSGKDLGILASLFYTGNALSSPFIPRIADVYGRKWTLAVSQLV